MKRVRVRLRGIVQGVGFRPFVHNLAVKLALAGSVRNSSAGLVAEVEGDAQAVDRFVAAIRSEAPPLAWIQDFAVEELPLAGSTGFAILESAVETGEFALISPDVATCAECLRDCREPGTPLRLSIHQLHQLRAALHHHSRHPLRPRQHHHGAHSACAPIARREYDDPADRRFHAQPNACSDLRSVALGNA